MKNYIVTGIVCFLLGTGVGFWSAPKQPNVNLSKPLMLRLSSQGRAEMQKMIQQVDRLLDHTAGDIMAEKTRMLQAITAKSPDRTAADFYLSGMEEKISETQAAIDKILLDAIQRMPLIDRRAYMDFYLEKKADSRLRGIILPLTAVVGFEGQDTEMTVVPDMPTVDPV